MQHYYETQLTDEKYWSLSSSEIGLESFQVRESVTIAVCGISTSAGAVFR